MPFGPEFMQQTISDPRNRDPLQLFGQIGTEAGLDDGLVEMLLGSVQNERREQSRARQAAINRAKMAQEAQARETQSDEGLLDRLLRRTDRVNPFEQVSRELR